MRAIDRLRLDRRVPPRVVENHIRRGREVQPEAGRLQRQQKHRVAALRLELRDQRLAILRLAGEHQVPDSGGGEPLPDDFEHRHELAEDEHLVALVAQLLHAFEQFLELGRRRVAVRRAEQRRVAADLAQLHQARENAEARLVELPRRFHAEQLRPRALELRLIQPLLLALELQHDVFLGARRQVGRHLRLRPP